MINELVIKMLILCKEQLQFTRELIKLHWTSVIVTIMRTIALANVKQRLIQLKVASLILLLFIYIISLPSFNPLRIINCSLIRKLHLLIHPIIIMISHKEALVIHWVWLTIIWHIIRTEKVLRSSSFLRVFHFNFW